jgi:hypothetical protein
MLGCKSDMFNRRRKNKVAEAITRIASSTVVSDAAFRQQARDAALAFGSACISDLAQFFHNPPTKPDALKDYYNGLGQWMSVCQFAAFEILYNLGESALPFLRKVAFGEYDWIQGNAIEILCRLAAEGIDRERTISELRRQLPDIRYEAQLYAAGPLLEQADTNAAIAEILQALDVGEFQEALEELRDDRRAS